MAGVISPPFGGYIGSSVLMLLTLAPVTTRTCKAKRETCIRFHQYSSLLLKVYNVDRGGALTILEMLHNSLPLGI
jgi:hypothetical protein